MHRRPRKPVLTVEQKHQKRRADANVLQVLRRVQARDQANQAACLLRVDFWTAVERIAIDKADREIERRRIEEELEKKRRASQEHKRQEQLRFMADQEKAEADLREEKRREAEAYAKRAKERFLIAVKEERRQRCVQRFGDDSTVAVERTRKIESEKELVRRDSMIPREGIPQATPISSSNLNGSSLLSPFSYGRSSFGNSDSTLTVALPRNVPTLRPRQLRSKENIQPEKEKVNLPQKNSEMPLRRLENLELTEAASCDKTERDFSIGSIIDLGKENREPLRAALSPCSYSTTSIVSLGGRRMVPLTSSAASPEKKSVAISVQSSLLTCWDDSNRTQDSEALQSIFENPAVQLSPPKHPPNPHHTSSRRPLTISTITTQSSKPMTSREQSTLPSSENMSLEVFPRRGPLQRVENQLSPLPESKQPHRVPIADSETGPPATRGGSITGPLATRGGSITGPLATRGGNIAGPPATRGRSIAGPPVENVDHQPLRGRATPRPPGGSTLVEPPGVSNPAILLEDLDEVMRALELLEANILPVELDSFTLSVSSGPLSTLEVGGLDSDESWISHQTLSSETSFQGNSHHHTTLESGTLFTSMSCSSRVADSADVTMETGPMDLSFLQWINVSGLSNGCLDDFLSGNYLDLR